MADIQGGMPLQRALARTMNNDNLKKKMLSGENLKQQDFMKKINVQKGWRNPGETKGKESKSRQKCW
jgi:hypothetical protein